MISSNSEESLKHIQEDYEILMKEGIEKFIKVNFITWLKWILKIWMMIKYRVWADEVEAEYNKKNDIKKRIYQK